MATPSEKSEQVEAIIRAHRVAPGAERLAQAPRVGAAEKERCYWASALRRDRRIKRGPVHHVRNLQINNYPGPQVAPEM